jgi:hypothetical protein
MTAPEDSRQSAAKLASAAFLIIFTREFYIALNKHMDRTSCKAVPVFGNHAFQSGSSNSETQVRL